MAKHTAKSLQETSHNRVKNWPNTLDAVRIRREEDRIRRLEDEEVRSFFRNETDHITLYYCYRFID